MAQDETTGRIAGIWRYPVKGLGPDPLESVALSVGDTLPLDRAYAIENGPSRFDPFAPKHLPKTAFLMLMRNERLAGLDVRFEDAGHTLTILRDGRQVARGALAMPIGRTMIEQFLASYMEADLRGAPRVVSADGHSFSDVADRVVHIVNRESVAELERIAGGPIDPLRFRPNIMVEGLPAWSEFDWVGGGLRIGGSAVLDVTSRTDRCAATNVDPATGARDMAIPSLLERTFGHSDFGVYAAVTEAGTISVGDPVTTSPRE